MRKLLLALITLSLLAQSVWASEQLQVSLDIPIQTLDPLYFSTRAEQQVGDLLYDRLVTYRPAPGHSGNGPLYEIVPALAESWDLSSDQRSYTFHLHKNARFHNGRPVRAVDVLYSIQRIANPISRSPGHWALERLNLESIQLLDDDLVEITLKKPHPYALELLALPYFSIVPKEEVERRFESPPPYVKDLRQLPFASSMVDEHANQRWLWFARHPIGTGPYQLKDWNPETGMVQLEQSPQYFLANVPIIPQLQFFVIPQEEEAFRYFREKKLAHTRLPYNYFKRVLADPSWNAIGAETLLKAEQYQNLEKSRIVKSPQWEMHGISMNNQVFPFNHPKVRQAFNYAIDKQYISDILLQSYARPMEGLLPPGFPGYQPRNALYPYQPDKARKLLFEAGWKDTDLDGDLEPVEMPQLSLTLWHDTSPMSVILSQAVQKNLVRIGVTIHLQPIEQWTQPIPPPFFHTSWMPEMADPAAIISLIFHSSRMVDDNTAHYSNHEVDQWLNEAETVMNPQYRFELYQKSESRILEDAPWIFLVHPITYRIVQPDIKHYVEHPLLPFPYQLFQKSNSSQMTYSP